MMFACKTCIQGAKYKKKLKILNRDSRYLLHINTMYVEWTKASTKIIGIHDDASIHVIFWNSCNFLTIHRIKLCFKQVSMLFRLKLSFVTISNIVDPTKSCQEREIR